MSAESVRIIQPILGLEPYVLVQLDLNSREATLDAGGLETLSDIRALASAMRRGSRKLVSQARRQARAQRKADFAEDVAAVAELDEEFAA